MMRPNSEHRVGRRRSTTTDHLSNVAIDLFAARGFDEVSVDDVAHAAGIARRTLFRYYPSKSALPWGDFDAHLELMRDQLADLDPGVPIGDALRTALLAFNTFDESRDRTAPAADAGHPADGRAPGVLDDDVCGMARRGRGVRGEAAGRQGERPRAADRGVDDARASRCPPTSSGWPTSRCLWPTRSTTHSTRSATVSARLA